MYMCMYVDCTVLLTMNMAKLWNRVLSGKPHLRTHLDAVREEKHGKRVSFGAFAWVAHVYQVQATEEGTMGGEHCGLTRWRKIEVNGFFW